MMTKKLTLITHTRQKWAGKNLYEHVFVQREKIEILSACQSCKIYLKKNALQIFKDFVVDWTGQGLCVCTDVLESCHIC